MKRFALNFICKNESHIITRMLESTLPLTDLIVALDTGSTDETILVIENFGKKHSIPTFVFSRDFDNFCNSRNAALNHLREVVNTLQWDRNDTWGFWIDCDEWMTISAPFKKEAVSADVYFVRSVTEDATTYSKQLFFSLSKDFIWKGPVHEYMTIEKKEFTAELVHGIHVFYEPSGASWKGDLEKKFLRYVELLEAYIQEGNNEFRWLFYVGESYSAAAFYCRNRPRRKEYLRKAQAVYQKLSETDIQDRDNRYTLHYRMADNLIRLDASWRDVEQDLLIAYECDKRHGEPHARLIEHYSVQEKWAIARIYSSFSVDNYHNNKPTDKSVSELEDRLYDWMLLYYHYVITFKLCQKEDATQIYNKLLQVIEEKPDTLTHENIKMIRGHHPIVLSWHQKVDEAKIWFKSLLKRSKLIANFSDINQAIVLLKHN